MMRKNFTPRSVALTAIPLLFGIYVVPASAAISLGTITFDAAGTEHQQPLGPFFETTSGVLMTLTTDNHLHLGDRSGDGNPDLYNHNNITQTLTFSRPVSILGFDVVADAGGFGAQNNEFKSSAGGEFSIEALGNFDVTIDGAGVWENITWFSWQQFGGEFTIDNVKFSAVPIPAAFWLALTGFVALLKVRKA